MKAFNLKDFLTFFKSQNSQKDFTARNKQLLQNDLENCKTLLDIKHFKEVFRLCVSEYTSSEFIDMLVEISVRSALIIYCNKEFPEKYYPACKIWRFFQESQNHFQCDAILFHIKTNIADYTKQRGTSDMSIFENMAKKRKAEILEQLQTSIRK